MDSSGELYVIADELRAIANLGLAFYKNDYDRQRYEHVLAASGRLVAVLDGRAPDEVMAVYRDNLNHLSPLVGAEAAVFRGDAILLIQRADNGLWAMPGGLVDVGETAAEGAVRELWEEAGVRGMATRLLGISDSRVDGSLVKAHMYAICFEVDIGDATPSPGPEARAIGFFAETHLPSIAPGHDVVIPMVFRLRGEGGPPWFDHHSPAR
jgi:ADP-ribose pyrophosphatase YjhB (NUDIX family)